MITLLDDQLKKLNPADSSSIPTPGSTEAERIYETAVGLRHSPTPPMRQSVLQSTDPVRFFGRRAVRRVTAVLVAAAIVAVFLAPLPSLHLFGTGATGGHVSKLGPCESRWLEVRAWSASPLPVSLCRRAVSPSPASRSPSRGSFPTAISAHRQCPSG